jgi:FkbM family methyltransferase
MNLYTIKRTLIKNFPRPVSDFFIWLWRKPMSPIRNYLVKKSAQQVVEPYYKKITYKDSPIFMYIDSKESWVSKEVHFHGMHEEHILEVIIDNLKQGDTFIDVGANVGQHSIYAAQKVGPNGKVFAFEPIDSSAENIRLSASKNSFTWLTVIQKAATNFVGDTVFYKYELTDISSRNKNFTDRPAKEVKVKTTTLDIELNNLSRIDLVKIDVEGYEMDVLRGAEQIIKKFKPAIILEFSPVFYKRLQPQDSMDILQFLFDHGYKITDVDNYIGPVTDITEYCKKIAERGDISNILCVQR